MSQSETTSSLSEVTNVERAGWQRRAAAELARILHAHRDLPVLAWTVAAAGCGLVGQVTGLAPAAQVRWVFHAWRQALGIPEPSQTTFSDATVVLRAVGERNRVQVGITATILATVEVDR